MDITLPLHVFDPSKLIMESPKRLKSSQENIERTLSTFLYKHDIMNILKFLIIKLYE